MAQSVQLYLLGTPRIIGTLDGVAISSSKAQAMIAYLAVTRQPQPRENLMTILWSGSSTDAAAKNIRNTLWNVRKAFEEDIFVTQGDTIAISPAVWCDVHEFEDLTTQLQHNKDDYEGQQQRLLDLYGGQLMGRFALPKEADFDIWLTLERERLEQTFLRTVNELITLHRLNGNWNSVISLCLRALSYDNFQENVHAALMEAYARQGKRANALRQYEALVGVLQETFDIEPQPEIQRLHQAIVDGKIRLSSGGTVAQDIVGAEAEQIMRQSSTRITERAAALVKKIQSEWKQRKTPEQLLIEGEPPRLVDAVRLVARSEQYASLIHAYYRAESGQSGGVLITGEQGMGKTRLLQQFERWLISQNHIMMKASAASTDEPLPYQLIRQALRTHVHPQKISELRFSDAWRLELSRLFPQLRTSVSESVGQGEKLLLYEAIAQFGIALGHSASNTVLVIMVDGLPFADSQSLDALQYLVRYWHEQNVPFLLIATAVPGSFARNPETGVNLTDWLAKFGHTIPVRRVALTPIMPEDVAKLMPLGVAVDADITNETLRDFGAKMYHLTRGNPFYLVEYLQLLLDEGRLTWTTHEDGDWVIDLDAIKQPDAVPEIMEFVQQNIPTRIQEAVQIALARVSVETLGLLSAVAVLGESVPFVQMVQVADMQENDALHALEEALQTGLLEERTPNTHGRMSYGFRQETMRDVLYMTMNSTRKTIFHRRAFDILRADESTKPQAAYHAVQAHMLADAVQLYVEIGDLAQIEAILAEHPSLEESLEDALRQQLELLRQQ